MQDVHERRSAFPALQNSSTMYFDGPGGSQVPTPVINAIDSALRESMSNTGWPYPASDLSASTVTQARQAVKDLFGGSTTQTVFGPSATALTYRIANALADNWTADSEVVVSQLDHDANVRPWIQAAERAGATVRTATVDPLTCELPLDQYDDLITDRTALVAVTASSNAVGTRPDIAAIAKRARAVGALVFLDAVHAAPHHVVDIDALGVDFITCSAYKFFGPHVGCLAAPQHVLEPIHPPRLAPATDRVPERFELGTLPFEQLAGVTAAVDYVASLDGGTQSSRRQRLRQSLASVEQYSDGIFPRLRSGLEQIEGVTVYGKAASRCPTLIFTVAGQSANDVAYQLGQRGFAVPSGGFYAYELMHRLNLRETGAVRVGLLHYNTAHEVDQLLNAVADVAKISRRTSRR